MFGFVLFCITLCPFEFRNHTEEEEKVGCFAIIVLQIYCYSKCSLRVANHVIFNWKSHIFMMVF